MGSLEIGQIVDGKVSGIKKFGAFVELPNGEVGLVHISQVSKDYVENIEDVLTDGQPVKVKILNFDEVDGKKRISLSIRQAALPTNLDQNKKSSFPRSRSESGSGAAQIGNTPKKSNNFEDMLAKFKKDSDEKMSSINQRLDGF